MTHRQKDLGEKYWNFPSNMAIVCVCECVLPWSSPPAPATAGHPPSVVAASSASPPSEPGLHIHCPVENSLFYCLFGLVSKWDKQDPDSNMIASIIFICWQVKYIIKMIAGIKFPFETFSWQQLLYSPAQSTAVCWKKTTSPSGWSASTSLL